MSMDAAKSIKEVTVPLKVEELKELIEQKSSFYHIDYVGSQLKDIVFLNYISNLDLPCEIKVPSTLAYEQKQSLMRAYFTTRNIVKVKSLSYNAAQVLLEKRGTNTESIFSNPYFSRDEVARFISENAEVVDRWERFIESTAVFAMYTTELNKELDIKSKVPVIDDANYLGANIVNMFSVPSFMELFFLSPPRHELAFFRPQFEESMFKGRNLYEYFFCPENEVYGLFAAQVHGGITSEMMADAVKESYEIINSLKK